MQPRQDGMGWDVHVHAEREKPLIEGEETLVEDLFTYRLDITFGILMLDRKRGLILRISHPQDSWYC